MSNLVQHVALISESGQVGLGDVCIVASALQKQVVRDFAPVWNVDATVSAFERLEDMPPGYWPVLIQDSIPFDAAGIHLDRDGQPFALVVASSDRDVWSLTASHEVLEMLADPFGDRLIAGDSPKPDQGRVMILVEVCDPSEAAEFGYTSNGVLVSDFYTPRFFDPVRSDGVRYSFTDAIREPRQVLQGGYLSWLEPVSGDWWQEIWFQGTQSTFRNLGPLTAAEGPFREQIDMISGEDTGRAIEAGRAVAMAAGLPPSQVEPASQARAAAVRARIAELTGAGTASASTRGARGRSRRRRPPTGRRD